MSELKAEVVEVNDILSIPKADKLELAQIKGWQCVVGKNQFQKGSKAIYIPIDSILPEQLEKMIFGPDSKITLHNHRIKTIKIRGAISQGLLVSIEQLGLAPDLEIGTDLTYVLGITKYEPPTQDFQKPQFRGRIASKKESNPNFYKYTDIQNIKNYPELFELEEEVVVTEKIHGSNFRAGWVSFVPSTLWQKIKALFGVRPKWQFVYGSHNVQLQDKMLYDGFYETNVYAEMVKKYDLKDKIPKGVIIYAEIYGDGIQKEYNYGCQKGEHKLILFDAQDLRIKPNGEYTNWETLVLLSYSVQIPLAPVLFKGQFKDCNINQLVSGTSILNSEQKIREGCVIKPVREQYTYAGRKILKCINEEYLLKDNSEFH